MNIAILTEYFPESESAEITGGVENRCFHLVKELSKKHNITVLCSKQKDQSKESQIFNAKIIRCGPINPYSNKGNIINRIRFANSLIKEGKKLKNIDIVHGTSFLTYLPAFKIGKKLNAKKIATWHETWIDEWVKHKGIKTGLPGELYERKSIRKKWDKIITVSKFTKNKLLEKNSKCKNIEIVHNGVDLKKFKFKTKKFEDPTLCSIGRLTKQKRLDLVIKAMNKLTDDFPKLKLKAIGQGDEINSLKLLAKELGLENNIDFLGFVKKHKDVLKTLKASHLYVSASELEGFGITVLEALACEVPYVISNIKPYKEVTQNGKGGLIFEKDNLNDLYKKIKKLLENKNLYKQKKKQTKKFIKNYEWENIAKKQEKIYQRLVQ